MGVLKGHIRSVRVRREGARVLVIEDGQAILDLPWQAADDLARALTVQARRAEEEARAEQIVGDQALLIRAGAPFGLTNRPDLLAEAAKEAAWNSRLRRYLPGVPSGEQWGTPTIAKHSRKGDRRKK
jgi:hypothetical protein